jgi:SAM-dependent methyltransferase
MTQATIDVEALDPYAFMAVLGKRVIHPGGRRSTEELFRRAGFARRQRVLDVGCGVGTTAVEIARRFGAHVTAVDIAPLMLERARANVSAAGLDDRVSVERGDIVALDYPEDAFDRVIAEAVTMFVDRRRAAAELVRVCRPGGLVLATEFLWRTTPSEEAREAFLGQVCPGMTFDTFDDWVRIYSDAGLDGLDIASGPLEMMSARGFLKDEGVARSAAIVARVVGNGAYRKKMAWLYPRIARAVPYLGYIVVAGRKPARTEGA